MLQRLCTRASLAAVLLALATAMATAQTPNDKRNDEIQAANRQIGGIIAAHQQSIKSSQAVKAAADRKAKVAAVRAQAAAQKIASARFIASGLESDAEHAVANLRQIEQELIDSQADDSKLTLAMADAARQEQELQEVRRRILESPAYRAAYDRALASANKAEELPRVREHFIGNSDELHVAKRQLSRARAQLEQARIEVFRADPLWMEAETEVRSAREAADEAALALHAVALGKLSALATKRKAQRKAAAAAAAAKQNAARIKNLQAQQQNLK